MNDHEPDGTAAAPALDAAVRLAAGGDARCRGLSWSRLPGSTVSPFSIPTRFLVRVGLSEGGDGVWV
ncbi:hypothetical protein F8O01_10110 [Pseudoclavibacter chungangensis]|uniref:Uncharacterized protein n=1 Tax=Pseudoclavibacter chungangensis TaxID=587635 RepID=A0A7J5BRT9_9MICO|nr:hypothetical protein [Pseudoclavibacter chungangensis]KAB1656729.1 hypothetical protein F8O01_10110 [Pseudoclavibacter chungangensis]NYJ67814.1 hypothetical protein [Pseudoclavibacter chungangensis]